MIPSEPIVFWRYFDIITLIPFFFLIAILIKSYYKKTGKILSTISETVAHSDRSSLVFSIGMSIIFPLYYAFIWLWVGPITNMPSWFYYILAFSAICETIFVWIPHKPDTKGTVHKIAAYAVGIVMLAVPVLILLFGEGLSELSTISIVNFVIISILLGLLLFIKDMRKYTLLFEVTFCLSFIITVSTIAHS